MMDTEAMLSIDDVEEIIDWALAAEMAGKEIDNDLLNYFVRLKNELVAIKKGLIH